MAYDALRNGLMFSQCFYNVFTITSELQDIVRPALRCSHGHPKVPNFHIRVHQRSTSAQCEACIKLLSHDLRGSDLAMCHDYEHAMLCTVIVQ